MTRLRTRPDARGTARALADAVIDELVRLVDAQPSVEWVISGGFISERVLPLMAPRLDEVEWSRVRVWWADERYVPAGDPHRNDEQAIRGLFSRTPGATLMPMPSDSGQSVDEAAAEFLTVWNREMAGSRIDVALIGMGPDGHIASLFPNGPWSAMNAPAAVLPVVDSPKPPPRRITLSMPFLQAARTTWIGACGSAKAPMIARVLRGGVDPREAPVAGVLGSATTLWMDRAAAADIDPALL